MDAPLETRKIEIEQETLNYLNTIRKWAMFFAIIGFIFLGLMVLIGLIAGTFLTAFNTGERNLGIPESLTFVPVLILAAVCFFPGLYLFRFSKHTSHAIQTLDKKELHKAFKNLKAYFAYVGILIILVFSIYFVVLIIAGFSMSLIKGLG
jgi:hypothetical protein